MNQKITPVILCGGNGTRLWPLSRPHMPKPFLQLLGERSLFQETIDRVSDSVMFTDPIIVAGASHVAIIKEQLAGRPAKIMVEPASRNTAAAIALAAHYLGDGPMLVCPSDHHIADSQAFLASVQTALSGAIDGMLMTFGIRPERAETGYGYLERGQRISDGIHIVTRFEEKPDAQRASAFLASGKHSWNGGIFLFNANIFLEELRRYRPNIFELSCKAIANAQGDEHCIHPESISFAAINGESIDYAVMEYSDKVAMVEADIGWSDVGSFASLAEHLTRDENGNAFHGKVDCIDAKDVTVFAGTMRVSIAGINNIIVAIDGNEILITRAAKAQFVGQLPGAKGQ